MYVVRIVYIRDGILANKNLYQDQNWLHTCIKLGSIHIKAINRRLVHVPWAHNAVYDQSCEHGQTLFQDRYISNQCNHSIRYEHNGIVSVLSLGCNNRFIYKISIVLQQIHT